MLYEVITAAQGYIDEVIEPGETRSRILHALQVSENKTASMPTKKHGIPPF